MCEVDEYSLRYQRSKFAAAEGVGGTEMGRREKASAEQIRNGAGEEASSLSGESTSTHQGARKRGVGCVGGTDGEDPKMAQGGRSGLQGAPSVDWCDQARVWSHAAATTSPRCAFKWFAHHLGQLQAPLVAAEEEGVSPLNENDMIMHQMQFSKRTAPHVIGRGGRMLRRIEDFCGVFLSLRDVAPDAVELTLFGPLRGCALARFIGEMLNEGIYSVIDTLARQGF